MSQFTGPQTGNHIECVHCGELGVNHEKVKSHDGGPGYHYEYHCPNKDTRYETLDKPQ